MSNPDVQRYAMPILPDGRLAEPVEAERGYWMLTTDYDQDTAALVEALATANETNAVLFQQRAELEAENKRLHASIELLDTLPDAHKIVEQVATIERLREILEHACDVIQEPNAYDLIAVLRTWKRGLAALKERR